jgi:hypothetical protein
MEGVDVLANIEHAVHAGAAALVKGGVVTDRVTGDVLHDHDWTPMEAARVVLEAAGYRGAVDALDELRAILGMDLISDGARVRRIEAKLADPSTPRGR